MVEVVRTSPFARALDHIRRTHDPLVVRNPNGPLPGSHLIVRDVARPDELVSGLVLVRAVLLRTVSQSACCRMTPFMIVTESICSSGWPRSFTSAKSARFGSTSPMLWHNSQPFDAGVLHLRIGDEVCDHWELPIRVDTQSSSLRWSSEIRDR